MLLYYVDIDRYRNITEVKVCNKPVDSVRVQRNIIDVEADTSQVLLRHDTLLGGPLEACHH